MARFDTVATPADEDQDRAILCLFYIPTKLAKFFPWCPSTCPELTGI